MMILYFQFILDEYSKMIFPSPAPYIYIYNKARERDFLPHIYRPLNGTGRDGSRANRTNESRVKGGRSPNHPCYLRYCRGVAPPPAPSAAPPSTTLDHPAKQKVLSALDVCAPCCCSISIFHSRYAHPRHHPPHTYTRLIFPTLIQIIEIYMWGCKGIDKVGENLFIFLSTRDF